MEPPGTAYRIEVYPRLPERFARLEEIANDLWYSWHQPSREFFRRLDPALWRAVGHSPKAFLRRVNEPRLSEAAENPALLENFNQVLAAYDGYRNEPAPVRRDEDGALLADDLVAYFCAEFGFHESLPIYSGGLGILAGDYCKAASDLRLRLVGVGLLYRQGYFLQSIDNEGRQVATYTDSDFADLPVTLVRREDGAELRVEVEISGRMVSVRVWRARVGHVEVFLLDTDVAENSERDRAITYRLYGGDGAVRIEQELVLGVGGVRALRALKLNPTVWHMNEGHPAFLVLERMRELVAGGLEFAPALEAVAVNTVFTTHTAVPAGHDQFADDMIAAYFPGAGAAAPLERNALLALGRMPALRDFNMTALAVRGSRFRNAVSRLHRQVTAQMLQALWPEIPPDEIPLDYVTNGVHVPTFLQLEWAEIFDRFLGPGWGQRLDSRTTWDAVDKLPDHIFWSVHQHLKSRMFHEVRQRLSAQHLRNQSGEAHLNRLLRSTDPDNPNVLTIGFARRFATYKRATLLFDDLDGLQEIISDPRRPLLFIFAGRAHPADQPGQALIRTLTEVARRPEFEGRLLLVEGYDLRLARRLISGVDVWLNNPLHGLEASGTSGMKAAMNGVVNLSMLDGWWDEGFEGDNGWAIRPATGAVAAERRDREEARSLYEILRDQVIPLYYDRGELGYSRPWIRMAKRSMASILPRYNATRMVNEYLAKFYLPAATAGRRYHDPGFAAAKTVAAWKARVCAAWPGVALRRHDVPPQELHFGAGLRVELGVALNGLAAEEVVVELLLSAPEHARSEAAPQSFRLLADGSVNQAGEHRFALTLTPECCGRLHYRIRAYPWHPLLAHRFELGLMHWC